MGTNKIKRTKEFFCEKLKAELIDSHVVELLEPLREWDRIAEDWEFAGLLIDGIVVCENL